MAAAEFVSPIWGISVGGRAFRIPSADPKLEWFEKMQVHEDGQLFLLYYTRIAEVEAEYMINSAATALFQGTPGADPLLAISGIAFLEEGSGVPIPMSRVTEVLEAARKRRVDKESDLQLKKEPAKSCLKQAAAAVVVIPPPPAILPVAPPPAILPVAPAALPPVAKVIEKKKTTRGTRELKSLLVDHPHVPLGNDRQTRRPKRFVP
jgi:hypothetical protein